MGFYQVHKNEIHTLHLISQIIGKIKLEYASQEPQWAHVMLDITPRGFSTGLLTYNNSIFFEIEMNLSQHIISITTTDDRKNIQFKNGKTIQTYYHEIMAAASSLGMSLTIHTKPQEMTWITPFEEDTTHKYYDEQAARDILSWFQLAWDIQTQYIAPIRQRKVYPGLFWGTFDVSCIIIYNAFASFPDDSQIIERAAFDEHMVEFGFWLGDDQYTHPTFFTLPYPFVEDVVLETDDTFPEGSYFNPKMAEYLYELKDGIEQVDAKNVLQFIDASGKKSMSYLSWQDTTRYFEPLKMKNNKK